MTAPTLSVSDKSQIVAEVQKSMGVQDKGDTIKNFLATLASNNRLRVLEGVCEKFALLMSASRGEVELTITSAQPLDSKVVKQLESAISKSRYLEQGQKLKVVPKVRVVNYGLFTAKTNTDRVRRSTPIFAAAWSWKLATEPSISACRRRLHA